MSEFWSLTLREIDIVLQGFIQAKDNQYNLAYYTAYHAGFFSQQHKKFPDYNKYAPKGSKQAKRRQTPEELRRNVMIMVAACGGKVPPKNAQIVTHKCTHHYAGP